MNEPDDDADSLSELIQWQQDDRARKLIERGDLFYGKKTPSVVGKSVPAKVWRSVMGDTEKKHLRFSRLDDEERFPEIYSWKREASWKHASALAKLKAGGSAPAPTHITKGQFIDLYSAVWFANGYGVPMNCHVIIQWGFLGYTDHSEAANQLQDGFLKHLDGWFHYNMKKNHVKFGIENNDIHDLFWIYSNECSPSGFHTHLLVGMPYSMIPAFRIWVADRLAKLSKRQPMTPGVVKIVSPPSDPIERQWIFFQYLCKGLDPDATVEIPGYERPVPLSDLIQFSYANPGHITCKSRVGRSRNLSPTARKMQGEGVISPIERGIFDRREVYSARLHDEWHRENYWKNFDLSKLID